MIVLLIRLPTIGTRPQRNVTAISKGACGRPTANRKIAVNIVLINEIMICAHNRGEAAIKIAESRRNLVAANGVEIVLHAMSAAVRVEACFNKQAAGCDNSKHSENQQRGRASGKVSDVSQIIRFLSERVDDHLSQTFKISEW